MKRRIIAGVRPKSDRFEFDYTLDLDDDIIKLSGPILYRTEFMNKTYRFGYKFTDTSSSKDRSEFIHFIKGLTKPKISNHELTQFIERPLGELDKELGMSHIDCIIHPTSNRSDLVSEMIRCVNDYMLRGIHRCKYDVVSIYKNAPSDIEFDWELFDSENEPGTYKYNQMKDYVEEVLMPKIKSLDYFSTAQSVKPKYRRYITNYLAISEDDAKKIQSFQGSNILIIDDINTSGSTLHEIVRTVNRFNRNSNIFIYTLIGNM